MFGLGHLFYPWGFLVQGLAIVHFIRRRPENYWFYVIFFLGPPGAAVYILAEVLPDLGLLRGFFQGFGRRSRIQKVETDIIDNPSPANYEELGELYKDQREFAKAREAFAHAIDARGASPYTFYSRALCSLGLNDSAGGTAGGCIRSNRTTGPRGPAFRGGHADFDDPGDVVQLRKFSQNGEPRRRGARMAAEAGGEEAHA